MLIFLFIVALPIAILALMAYAKPSNAADTSWPVTDPTPNYDYGSSSAGCRPSDSEVSRSDDVSQCVGDDGGSNSDSSDCGSDSSSPD